MVCEVCGQEHDNPREHIADKHPYMLSYFDALEASKVVSSDEEYEENAANQSKTESIRAEPLGNGHAE